MGRSAGEFDLHRSGKRSVARLARHTPVAGLRIAWRWPDGGQTALGRHQRNRPVTSRGWMFSGHGLEQDHRAAEAERLREEAQCREELAPGADPRSALAPGAPDHFQIGTLIIFISDP